METLGSGAAVLDLLFQIGSYRSILFDFGTDISTWTFEFYLKKNKGDRLKTLSLTLGSGLSFPVYESDQIQAIFSANNTSIEEGQYYYELRRTDIALPLINGFAYFSFDAPQGTIDDTTLELTVLQQTITLAISNISVQDGSIPLVAFNTELTFNQDKDLATVSGGTRTFTVASTGNLNGVAIVARINEPDAVNFPAGSEAVDGSDTPSTTHMNIIIFRYFENYDGAGNGKVLHLTKNQTAI